MIELIALLRLIPYFLVAYIGWKKGYPRLTILAIVVIVITIITFTLKPQPEIRAALASIFSYFLLLHALNLQPRNKK